MNEHMIKELADTARGIPDAGDNPPTQEEIWSARETLEREVRKQGYYVHSGPCKLVGLLFGSLSYITLATTETTNGQYLAYDMGVE